MSWKPINTYVVEILTNKNNVTISRLNQLLLTNFVQNVEDYSILQNSRSLKMKLRNVALPKKISKIADNKISLSSNVEDIDVIRMVTLYLDIFSEEINIFLEKKEEYESFLFKGSYESAMSVLDYIEKNISFTLWGGKQKLIINDLIGGLEQNKLYLETITKEANGKAYLEILFNSYSTMSEKQTSYDNYQSYIKKFFANTSGNMISYLKYKLDLDYKIEIDDFNGIIQIESFSSVIDLYLSFVELYPKVLFLKNENSIPKSIYNSLAAIDDIRMNNLLLKVGLNEEYLNEKLKIQREEGYSDVIDAYSIGDYDTVIDYFSEYLKDHPSDFQSTTIYIKSLIQGQKGSNGLSDIAACMYDMYALNDNYSRSKQKMYRYRKQYKETSWEPKIVSFLSRRDSIEKSINITDIGSYLNDNKLTPNFSNIIFNDTIENKFKSVIKKEFPETTKIIYDNDISSIRDNNRKRYMELGNRDLNISKQYKEFESVIFSESYDLFSRERASIRLSEILLINRDYFSYIKLTVKLYFENNLLINRMHLKECFSKIGKRPSFEIKSNISYPLFVYLFDMNNKRAKNIAVANFFDTNKITSLETLLNFNVDKKYKIFFLASILDIYTLKKDVRFLNDNTNAEDVRLEILKWLVIEDQKSKKQYIDEINEINKQIALKDRISRINKSKIFVDTQKILNENKAIWEEDYGNYLISKKFDREIYAYDIENLKGMSDIEYFNKRTRDINFEIQNDLTYQQEFLMLRNLLNKVLDELLTNTTHGLETYLSSRIRHGYAKNHLTNVFYKYNLMSKSDSTDNKSYLINDYWDSKQNFDPKSFSHFKQLISQFTANIDNIVATINSEWIQIKRSKNDSGLFSYTELIDISTVAFQDNNFSNFKELFDSFVSLFWTTTETNLNVLRNKINTSLKKFFYDQLNEIEQEIAKINTEGMKQIVPECLSNINLCRTNIESTINDFSEVFEKPNTTHKSFTMEELCETALSISGKMHRDFDKINITQKIEVQDVIKGNYLPYFIDSLGILINNAIEHSGFTNLGDLELGIEVSKIIDGSEDWNNYNEIFLSRKIIIREKSNLKCIKVMNNFAFDVDINRIQNAFKSAESFDKVKEFVQSEGGSGLIKLSNIFKNSLPVPFIILYEVREQVFTISIVFVSEDAILDRGVK